MPSLYYMEYCHIPWLLIFGVYLIILRSLKWSKVAKSGDSIKTTTECVAYSVVSQSHDTEYEIPTQPCEAYGQAQQIPRVQEEADHEYEVIPGETNQPPT